MPSLPLMNIPRGDTPEATVFLHASLWLSQLFNFRQHRLTMNTTVALFGFTVIWVPKYCVAKWSALSAQNMLVYRSSYCFAPVLHDANIKASFTPLKYLQQSYTKPKLVRGLSIPSHIIVSWYTKIYFSLRTRHRKKSGSRNNQKNQQPQTYGNSKYFSSWISAVLLICRK